MAARQRRWGPRGPDGKRRKVWAVDFIMTYPDGFKERVTKVPPVQTMRGAEQWERDRRQELLDQWRREKLGLDAAPTEAEIKEKEVPTLAEFGEEFIDTYATSNNAPSEVTSKKAHLKLYLKPDLGDRRLNEITVRDVEKLKATLLKRELSPKTINNALGTLSRLLSYAVEAEVIATMVTIKRLKVPPPAFDFLTFEEADRLLEAARKHSADWHAQIFTALRTGLRYGELCELRWSDVDLVAGRLLVRRSFTRGKVKTPKSNRTREVPLSPDTVAVLKAHRHLRSELVFCKPDGGRRIHRRADVAIKKICKRAGLRNIGWHVLRHSFASHLVMLGRSVKEVQELLGHSTITMTMRYAHLAPTVKREAVALLDGAKSCEQGVSSKTPGGNRAFSKNKN